MIVLPDSLPDLNVAIVRRAQRDIPIIENPPGSNRSPEIDAMCKKWGVPLAFYWCALWATTVWSDCGADVPPIDPTHNWHPAKCETWRDWAMHEGLFTSVPTIGCAVLYGQNGHPPAEHIGVCIVSLAPIRMDAEGNTSLAGFSREGIIATIKPIDMSRVIGYVTPRLAK